jgi:glycogen debranching enzyme
VRLSIASKRTDFESAMQIFQRLLFTVFLLAASADVFSISAQSPAPKASAPPSPKLGLIRPARPWEFLSSVGKKASLLGNESGAVEAWVYPLKILRDLRLTILTEGRAIPAESLVRTVIAQPESTTLIYSNDTFSIHETFFAPINQPGAVIELQVETEQPLEIEASFIRDFQLEWPASMGGTYVGWSDPLRAFFFGEDRQKFSALAGSPTASSPQLEYETNYSGTHRSSMRLGVANKGRDIKLIVIAGSIKGRAEAETTYKQLTANYEKLRAESATFYRQYLQRTVSVELPDADLQRAYDWSRVSLIQGLVSNPTMGDGLIAGYRASGESYRPGFAWFFGRDSLWSGLALNAEGDFATTKTALEFIANFQRDDGKIPHEIAQGASFVDWFKAYPYAYASADATPLYIIGVDDYVTSSGDIEFAKANWQHIAKAYEFLRSTYNTNGFPRNFGIGHGWVEGGPLLPIESEFYQSGLAAAATRSLAHLSQLTGKDADAKSLAAQFDKEHKQLNDTFWSAEKDVYAFARDRDNQRVDEPSVLATVPMWFGLTDEDKSQQMISVLAAHEHQTDWGMRIISNRAAKFSGGGYHYGSVWPLFTGWASVAEYRYHQAQPAYDNLRANALLALDGSPGHVTEVLSGDYYQPLSTSSPHQIWSAAMVISPLLRGLFGLQFNAPEHTLTFAPHLPADWKEFAVHQIVAGSDSLDLNFSRTADSITVTAERNGNAPLRLTFSPSLSPRAQVLSVALNGKPLAFRLEPHSTDQHLIVAADLASGSNTLKIRLRNDFAVSVANALPSLGSTSEGLHILSQSWNTAHDTLTLETQGLPGKTYTLSLWGKDQIKSVDGARLTPSATLEESFPLSASTDPQKQTLTLHFEAATKR